MNRRAGKKCRMTLDLKAAEYTLAGLRPFPVAVTTNDGGRLNGLMSLSAGSMSIVPEAPRVAVSLTKYGEARAKLPPEWIEQYDTNHAPELQSARRYRGLPVEGPGGH